MAKVIERMSPEEEMREKTRGIFKTLEGNGLFAQEFSGLFKLLQGNKLREDKESAWHIKEGEWHWWDPPRFWWDVNIKNGMFISLSKNTITFIILPESKLLPKIREVAECITNETNFNVVIRHY